MPARAWYRHGSAGFTIKPFQGHRGREATRNPQKRVPTAAFFALSALRSATDGAGHAGLGRWSIDGFSFFSLERRAGLRACEHVRLAGPRDLCALSRRMQSALSHLPQRRAGLAAGTLPAHRALRGARLCHRAPSLAGRHRGHRRRAHRGPGPGPLAGRPEAPGPAHQDGYQRHASRRGRRPAGRGLGGPVRRGLQGALPQVSAAHGRVRHGRSGAPEYRAHLRDGRALAKEFLLSGHHGARPDRRGHGRHARGHAQRFYIDSPNLCPPREEGPCPSRS